MFVTKEDSQSPEALSTLVQEEEYGIILPSGEINWDCPCLGGMAYGPCGQEFKDAFSCFHYSTEEEKGSDCIPQFRAMQECFQKHPEVYGKYEDDDEKEEEEEESRLVGEQQSTEQELGSGQSNLEHKVTASTDESGNILVGR